MLVEFNVTNFRSLCGQQSFSLTKAKGGELAEANSFTTTAVTDFALLRSAAIYGPNAGGKSNFLLAMRAMREVVLDSATAKQRGDELPVTPFRLSQATSNAPSEFEVTLLVDQVRYQYGFSATEQRVHEEWLLAYPKGRPQRWFGRAWNEQAQAYDWEFGNNLSGEKQLWQKSTRENALFLSTAVQLNSEQLRPLYDWFDKTLRTTDVGGWNPAYTASLCGDDGKERVMEFLRAADIGIDDIQVEKKPFDPNMLPGDMPEQVKAMVADDMKGKQMLKIRTVHQRDDGGQVSFSLDDESDGTQKLFSFAGLWIDALRKGCVLFVDELHDNLHPRLVQFLVQLFHNSETNPKNAQLVFTTHDTSILNQEVFRRDQIWFCEKDADKATTLYPLTDFSPRKGRENLELAYFSGRYGALPTVRRLGKPG